MCLCILCKTEQRIRGLMCVPSPNGTAWLRQPPLFSCRRPKLRGASNMVDMKGTKEGDLCVNANERKGECPYTAASPLVEITSDRRGDSKENLSPQSYLSWQMGSGSYKHHWTAAAWHSRFKKSEQGWRERDRQIEKCWIRYPSYQALAGKVWWEVQASENSVARVFTSL